MMASPPGLSRKYILETIYEKAADLVLCLQQAGTLAQGEGENGSGADSTPARCLNDRALGRMFARLIYHRKYQGAWGPGDSLELALQLPPALEQSMETDADGSFDEKWAVWTHRARHRYCSQWTLYINTRHDVDVGFPPAASEHFPGRCSPIVDLGVSTLSESYAAWAPNRAREELLIMDAMSRNVRNDIPTAQHAALQLGGDARAFWADVGRAATQLAWFLQQLLAQPPAGRDEVVYGRFITDMQLLLPPTAQTLARLRPISRPNEPQAPVGHVLAAAAAAVPAAELDADARQLMQALDAAFAGGFGNALPVLAADRHAQAQAGGEDPPADQNGDADEDESLTYEGSNDGHDATEQDVLSKDPLAQDAHAYDRPARTVRPGNLSSTRVGNSWPGRRRRLAESDAGGEGDSESDLPPMANEESLGSVFDGLALGRASAAGAATPPVLQLPRLAAHGGSPAIAAPSGSASWGAADYVSRLMDPYLAGENELANREAIHRHRGRRLDLTPLAATLEQRRQADRAQRQADAEADDSDALAGNTPNATSERPRKHPQAAAAAAAAAAPPTNSYLGERRVITLTYREFSDTFRPLLVRPGWRTFTKWAPVAMYLPSTKSIPKNVKLVEDLASMYPSKRREAEQLLLALDCKARMCNLLSPEREMWGMKPINMLHRYVTTTLLMEREVLCADSPEPLRHEVLQGIARYPRCRPEVAAAALAKVEWAALQRELLQEALDLDPKRRRRSLWTLAFPLQGSFVYAVQDSVEVERLLRERFGYTGSEMLMREDTYGVESFTIHDYIIADFEVQESISGGPRTCIEKLTNKPVPCAGGADKYFRIIRSMSEGILESTYLEESPDAVGGPTLEQWQHPLQ